MRKIITLACLAVFSVSLIDAQANLAEWKKVLAQNDPVWKQGYETFLQEGIAAADDDAAWYPSLSAVPGYEISKSTVDGSEVLSQQLSLGMNLSQKLFTGGTLSSSFSQTLSSNVQGADSCGYKASGTVLFSQPLVYSELSNREILEKTFGKSRKISHLAGYARWQATQLRRIASTLPQFLNAAVLLLRQKNREALMTWYARTLENDQVLFEAGQLSSLEFGEARGNSVTVEKAYGESALSLASWVSQSKAWGIDPAGIDLDTWLGSIENDIASAKIRPAVDWEQETERYDIGRSLKALVKDEMSDLPSLSVSFSYTPGTTKSGKSDAWTAVSDYWRDDLMFDWSMNVSVSIPLMPWDPLWNMPKTSSSKRRSYRAQLSDIDRRQENTPEAVRKTLAQHKLSVSQAMRNWLLEKDRLELYRIKATSGNLSVMDLQYQEIQTEDARLDWYSARISYISSCLTGD